MQRIWVVAAAALAGVTLASGSALAGGDTIAISEPTTLALLAAGVGALAIARFRGVKP